VGGAGDGEQEGVGVTGGGGVAGGWCEGRHGVGEGVGEDVGDRSAAEGADTVAVAVAVAEDVPEREGFEEEEGKEEAVAVAERVGGTEGETVTVAERVGGAEREAVAVADADAEADAEGEGEGEREREAKAEVEGLGIGVHDPVLDADDVARKRSVGAVAVAVAEGERFASSACAWGDGGREGTRVRLVFSRTTRIAHVARTDPGSPYSIARRIGSMGQLREGPRASVRVLRLISDGGKGRHTPAL
jgi:hypothetical protein